MRVWPRGWNTLCQSVSTLSPLSIDVSLGVLPGGKLFTHTTFEREFDDGYLQFSFTQHISDTQKSVECGRECQNLHQKLSFSVPQKYCYIQRSCRTPWRTDIDTDHRISFVSHTLCSQFLLSIFGTNPWPFELGIGYYVDINQVTPRFLLYRHCLIRPLTRCLKLKCDDWWDRLDIRDILAYDNGHPASNDC